MKDSENIIELIPNKKESLKILFYLIPPAENLGVQYIISALKFNGYKPDLIIESLESNITNKVLRMKPHIICFSAMTGLHIKNLEVAKYFKKNFHYLSIMGGPHAMYFPEIIENNSVDIVSTGEAENSIVELLDKMVDGRNFTKTWGFWIKYDGSVYKNENADLPELVYKPDREIIYKKYSVLRNNPTKYFNVSRGCPFECTFCFNRNKKRMFLNKGHFIRFKKIELIIEEISEIRQKYPLEAIRFFDDTFTLNHQYLKEFLPMFHSTFPDLKYLIDSRFDTLNEEIIKLLKETGCDRITLGLETGNEELRNSILKKGITNETILRVARILKKYKIRVVTNSVYGFPNETIQNCIETIKMNRIVNPAFTFQAVLQPYPKTEIYDYCITNGLLRKNFKFDDIPLDFKYDSVLSMKGKSVFVNMCHLNFWLIKLNIPNNIITQLVQLKPNNLYYALCLLPELLRGVKYRDKSISKLIQDFFGEIKNYENWKKWNLRRNG